MPSLKGYEIPLGRTASEKAARQQVFDIIAPYFLSAEDMKIVAKTGEEEMALWLELGNIYCYAERAAVHKLEYRS